MNSDLSAASSIPPDVLPTEISGRSEYGGGSLHRRIWSIALPAILANLTTVLPGLCDTAFIGRGGQATEQAGVAIGTTFAAFLLWAFGFLRMGTTGVTAQGYGAGNPLQVRQALKWSVAMGVGFGLLLVIASPLGTFALPLYGGGAAEQDYAAQYFHLRILAAPFDLVLYAVMGWLIGLQRARTVFVLQLILNSVNIALCYLFVIVLDFGVVGVAGATALAQGLTASIAVYSAFRLARRARIPAGALIASAAVNSLGMLSRLMAINRNIFVRTLALMLIFTYFIRLSAELDVVSLAANQILMGFLALIANGLDGFAQSAETLVGEAVGARNRRGLSGALWGNLGWSLVLATGLSVALWAAGPVLLPLFSANGQVVEAARAHYPWVIIQPLVAVWCFLLDGVFIGATRGRELRNGMLMAAAAGLVAMHVAAWRFGNDGLWAALMLFFALRTLPLAWWYRRIPASLAS